MYDYLLKLERINEWYDGLIDELGLRSAVESGWPGEGNCFLSTPQQECSGPHVIEDKFGGVTFVSKDISSEHVTGAEQKLL